MNHNYYDEVDQQIVIGRRIDAFFDRWSRRCVEVWERGVRDPALAATICSRVRSRLKKIEAGEAIPFRRAKFQRGKVLLGRDLAVPWHFDGEIWLPEHFFGTPWLVTAGTGHGKSVLEANLALRLSLVVPATWQLSFHKPDLAGQLPRFREAGLDLIVVRAGDLKLNPLQAGANHPAAHLASVTARLARCLGDLPPRSDIILRGICHELYRKFKIFEGAVTGLWPTLFHVYERIRACKGLNVAARDSLLDRLGSFLERYSPACGAWLRGWDPKDLAGCRMAFLLDDASAQVKRFLLESLIDHVFQDRIEHGAANSKLDLLIFVDDAQHLVNSAGGLTMSGVDEKVGLIRGRGMSIMFFVQTEHGVSPHLLPNINGRLMGRTVDYESRLRMGRTLGLNEAQMQWVNLNLRRGWFVGAIAEGDWHEPFAFETENVNLANDVTEAEVLESQRPLQALPVILAEDFRNWERHPLLELQSEETQPVLSPGQMRFLEAVVREPGKTVGHYTQALGMNGKIARIAREGLVRLGLIREHHAQLNSRGKPALLLEPMPAARTFITKPSEET